MIDGKHLCKHEQNDQCINFYELNAWFYNKHAYHHRLKGFIGNSKSKCRVKKMIGCVRITIIEI